MFALSLVALCIVFGAVGQILMKNGMSDVGKIGGLASLFNFKTAATIFTNPFVLSGLALYAVSTFLWLGAMSLLNVSFMYPLLSLGYILVAVMSAIFLGEHITLVRWLGILLVVFGCFLTVQTTW
jgi:drug/metabolite transporter (DMT)-like permease